MVPAACCFHLTRCWVMQLLLLAMAAASGAAWLQQQAQLPPLHYGLLVIGAGFASWLLGRARSEVAQSLSFVSLALAFFLAGFCWAGLFGSLKLAEELDPRWYGRDVRVEGVVSKLTRPEASGTRFTLDIERVMTVGAGVPRRAAITWYGDRQGNGNDVPELRAGQRWQFTLRLRPPHGNYNPHGFDIEAWMLERGIRATGYVRSTNPARLVEPMVWRPGYAVERLREVVRANLRSLLDGQPYAGILIALAVGDQRAISRDQWRVLTRTGTNHLMSISGLHITLVAGLAFAVALRIWRRSIRLASLVSPLRAATLFGLLAAIAYAALSGFGIPAQRALCMLTVVAIALLAGWQTSSPIVLGAAILFVIVLDPMAVTSSGFWLSFAAVAAILVVARTHRTSDGLLASWCRVQWSITIVLVPLLLVLFQQVSLVSPFANAFAIPLVSFVVAPLALLLVVLPIEFLANVTHETVHLCFQALEALSHLPGAVWQQHAPVAWTIPLAVAGVALAILPRGFPSRWLAPLLLMPMFAVRPPQPAAGELWFTLLDVGQGLSAVVRTANHTVLFDTGPDYQGGNDAGSRIVAPFLRGEGIGELDVMIVSHDDIDHSGGTVSVTAALPADRILSSVDGETIWTEQAHPQLCHSGQTWSFDNVRFEVLHPAPGSYHARDVSDNDRSCVLRVVSEYGSVLLPADIERRSERQLLATSGSQLRADVLVAPHHGSRTSSSPEFVTAVAPQLVLFPVGYANRYGHPHPLVEARFREFGAKLLRTDRLGSITLRFTREGIDVSAWRQTEHRYWHGLTN